MKRTFVQFACDLDTIEALKFIAHERKQSLTSLCQELVFDFLYQYVQQSSLKMVNESQASNTHEMEEIDNG